ncbi:MAG: Grx4 family monothiol glutaredoxin [Planctomycetota bacterium]|nr:MAG: Grx4 family monothiol glutaredoxin [Planctomycetota bacterium]
MSIPEIDIARAKELLATEGATFVDIRDPDAFAQGRIRGAVWLSDGNLGLFAATADKERPTVVYCARGNASKAATLHLLQSGFREVYSLSEGFTAWDGPREDGIPEAPAPAGFSVRPLAQEKLRGYLAAEPAESAVRVTVEGGRFGLSLDSPHGGDLRFEAGGLPFVIDQLLAEAVKGLSIDYQEGEREGFALEGGQLPKPPGDEERLAEIKRLIAENKVMLFMKGTAMAPMCGFSARTVEALRATGKPFGHKNVLEDPRYRYVLSDFSNWPTIPQVFIDGKFVGGCDIVTELAQKGELQRLVDEAFASQPA